MPYRYTGVRGPGPRDGVQAAAGGLGAASPTAWRPSIPRRPTVARAAYRGPRARRPWLVAERRERAHQQARSWRPSPPLLPDEPQMRQPVPAALQQLRIKACSTARRRAPASAVMWDIAAATGTPIASAAAGPGDRAPFQRRHRLARPPWRPVDHAVPPPEPRGSPGGRSCASRTPQQATGRVDRPASTCTGACVMLNRTMVDPAPFLSSHEGPRSLDPLLQQVSTALSQFTPGGLARERLAISSTCPASYVAGA